MSPEIQAPKLTYRLGFYLAGLCFAILSYVIGTWGYAVELAAIESDRELPSFLQCGKSIMPAHPFTFITWMAAVTAIAVVLGYLFDREVNNRRRAEKMANIDGLTEIYNHRYFQERLGSEIERAVRYDQPLALVMFDLDDFKIFNDQHGHQEGDRLLKWFVKLCEQNTRSIDVLARYGGEEFVLILPETEAEDALVAADRIRQGMETGIQQHFPNQAKVTVSAGVAASPVNGKTRHTLILSADSALYFAKRQGKNRCYIYDEEHSKVYRATPERLKALLGDDSLDAIEALSAAVDAKDKYTCGHSSSVSRYCQALGEKIGLSEEEQESLRLAALLHDIGKIGTPDSILRKPGRLGAKERQVVEHHPGVGSQILQKMQQLNAIIPGVRHHHERYDGKGYPNKLAGKDIPLYARMIALADAFDAMTSDRPYRPALSVEEALAEIANCSGTQFDPDLVKIFSDLVRNQYAQEDSDKAA